MERDHLKNEGGYDIMPNRVVWRGIIAGSIVVAGVAWFALQRSSSSQVPPVGAPRTVKAHVTPNSIHFFRFWSSDQPIVATRVNVEYQGFCGVKSHPRKE